MLQIETPAPSCLSPLVLGAPVGAQPAFLGPIVRGFLQLCRQPRLRPGSSVGINSFISKDQSVSKPGGLLTHSTLENKSFARQLEKRFVQKYEKGKSRRERLLTGRHAESITEVHVRAVYTQVETAVLPEDLSSGPDPTPRPCTPTCLPGVPLRVKHTLE